MVCRQPCAGCRVRRGDVADQPRLGDDLPGGAGAAAGAAVLAQRTESGDQGTWLPKHAQTADLEAKLGGLTRTVLVAAQVQPGAYYRQYGGLIVGGHRIIYVNGFQRAMIDSSQSKAGPSRLAAMPALVCDGGALAFGVEYDPRNRDSSNVSPSAEHL